MIARPNRISWFAVTTLVCLVTLCANPASAVRAGEAPAQVYVVLWFDTEDYILPASDDAAKQVAEFLTQQGVRATFKVVGEKARTLARRGRTDVIEALKQHEIGYHANYHSVQPSPAMYLSNLGWDEGVAEFDRRERPGFEDVRRIFGVAPSCYGQPGSSWGPQSFGAMRKWGMEVYLDAGSHVQLDDKPYYYCGIFTMYKLEHQLRTSLTEPNRLEEAEQAFLAARKKLLAEGGGIVSIYYHPCEFVHQEFWDGVNFRNGANPPRELWRLPPTKTPEQTKAAYQVFEEYVRFIKRFPEVRFVTARDALRIYSDKARGRQFDTAALKEIAAGVQPEVVFQRRGDCTLSAGEVFALLTDHVAQRVSGVDAAPVCLPSTLDGPTGQIPIVGQAVTTDASQFGRAVLDVRDYLRRNGRIPSAVWLGSVPVPPEMFIQGLAEVTSRPLGEGKAIPETITLKPARLASAKYVADDHSGLWGWIIFPRGFRAPAMMRLAKQQAWTLKPALLDRSRN
jgi:hypothetical protein